jgi:hypothetical protein
MKKKKIEDDDKLDITIKQNRADNSIMTIHARSEKYEYETEKELWAFARFRMPYAIAGLHRDFNRVKKYLKLR